MEQSCRVCLLADQTTTFHLTDIREDETFADILSFISGIEVTKTFNVFMQNLVRILEQFSD